MPTKRSSLVVSIGCMLLVTSAFAGPPNICDGIAPIDNTQLVSVPIITGLSGPVLAVSPPGDTERIMVVEQDGVIRLH